MPFLWPTQAPYSTAYGAYESMEFTLARGLFPFLALGVILATGVLVGRVLCGWACPMGLVQDLLSMGPLSGKPVPVNLEFLKDGKTAVLLFSLFAATMSGFQYGLSDVPPMGVFSDAPFSVFDPSGTLFAYLPWSLLWKSNLLSSAGIYGIVKLVVLALSLGPSLFVPRFFCRNLCPMAALLEPLAPIKYLRVSVASGANERRANKVLDDVCPMGVQVSGDARFVEDKACIHCGNCVVEEPAIFGQQVF